MARPMGVGRIFSRGGKSEICLFQLETKKTTFYWNFQNPGGDQGPHSDAHGQAASTDFQVFGMTRPGIELVFKIWRVGLIAMHTTKSEKSVHFLTSLRIFLGWTCCIAKCGKHFAGCVLGGIQVATWHLPHKEIIPVEAYQPYAVEILSRLKHKTCCKQCVMWPTPCCERFACPLAVLLVLVCNVSEITWVYWTM